MVLLLQPSNIHISTGTLRVDLAALVHGDLSPPKMLASLITGITTETLYSHALILDDTKSQVVLD